MPTFGEKLSTAIAKSGGHLCVGLDPDPEKMPARFQGRLTVFPEFPDSSANIVSQTIAEFLREIVEATADVAAVYKPNLAFFECLGSYGWRALEATVVCIRQMAPHAVIIADGKREDIGKTARFYAKAAFEWLGVDAVTAGPYLGFDSYGEFLKDPARGCFLLCRTSNKSAGEFQDLGATPDFGRSMSGIFPLYQKVAMRIAELRPQFPNLGAVVGATYVAELAAIREILPDAPLLLPGVGKQGADVVAAVQAAHGGPFVVNSSSAIIFASAGDDFADASRAAAMALRDQINTAL